MFTTFSGSSRRPRNVNLSGQKSDPFAGTSWNTPSSAGPSKSVAEAQADRQKRQQERDRQKAALHIQRSWRGHRVRRDLKKARRQDFDRLYTHGSDGVERPVEALPLLKGVFDARSSDDCRRLSLVAQDLERSQYSAVSSGRIPLNGLQSLVQMLAAALHRSKESESRPLLITTLIRITEICPRSVSGYLDVYYSLLAGLGLADETRDIEGDQLLRRAILVPLVSSAAVESELSSSFSADAYRAFVLSFLSVSNIAYVDLFDANTSDSVDSERLSLAVLNAFASGSIKSLPNERLLWVLARFIGLQRSKAHGSTYAQALHLLLSALASVISIHFPVQPPLNKKSGAAGELPEYVRSQLLSLVDRREIFGLLDKFTFNYAGSSQVPGDDASVLAGYILTLIRCFPARGDDIRMRLYLAEMNGPSGKIPSTRFFCGAMTSTQIFSRVCSNGERATLKLLLEKKSQTALNLTTESEWDREWRTVLLFLELYVFVLRLTDDEDFFSSFPGSVAADGPPSRLGACSLPLDDVKNVSLFLKNLGFVLYYHAAELLGDGAADEPPPSLDDIVSLSAPREGKGKRKSRRNEASFNVISGIDFGAFRNVVATAMRMLYERDSRQQFLPKGHWLMTSRFDMDGFLSAVVLEEQRQHEIQENGSESDNEYSDGDDDNDVVMRDSSHQALTYAGQRRSHHARVEEFRAQHRKQTRERTMAAAGPRLEILRNMPFVIPFETRVQIFRQFVFLDKHRRRKGHIDADQWRSFVIQQNGNALDQHVHNRHIGRHHAEIRRNNAFNDAYEQFFELGDGLKEPIQITFVDQFDTIEAGIDGGGVTKEFLTSVTTEAFTNAEHNLFIANKASALYPNPSALDQLHESLRRTGLDEKSEEWAEQVQTLLQKYEFLGRVVGKCLYEGILIDIVFAGFFLLKWTSAAASATESGYRATINALREMDEELYQGLLKLKNSQEDVSAMELTFTVDDQVSLPGQTTVTKTRNLMPNGGDILVTNENIPLYISYVSRHRLTSQPYQQTKAFLRGLGSIIDPSWLSMFNQAELQRLVGGDSSEIDVEDLRRNTVYSGAYQIGDDGLEHPTIVLFWRAMREFRDDERRAVLKYVTSTPRAPLLGFSQLKPSFSIRFATSDTERLPSASTCVNLLKLPPYETLEKLKAKLRYAVTSNAGFDLS